MRMRIISGQLGGQQFDTPSGHRTHPMSEQIRGALFNILGDISGMTILDAFAGSGAIAYEAVSRGAQTVTAVETDPHAHGVIMRNLERLGIKDNKAVRANVSSWSDNNANKQFDIVVCDPPYDDVQLSTVQKLTKHVLPGGTFVISWPASEPIPEFEGLQNLKQKTYGDAQLVFYKKTG